MAGFNLTAQLNLRGPNNVRQIVSDIRRQLGTITGDVNLRINATATRNITQLNAALTTLNTNLSQTQNNANAAANAITAFANAANSINRASATTSRQINAVTSATTRLSQSQRSAQKALAGSATEMEEFGKQSALAVRRFAAFSGATGVILGLTNAFRSGINAFIEYEKEFVKVQQVTDKTASQLKGLDSEIRRLSVGLGVASSDLINVSSTLAQAGLTAGETQKALQALALTDLSPSFDSLNDTVEGSIALMRQFGIGAAELERSLGSVNAVAAAFAVESGDLIAAIQRTGGVFAAASKGVSEGTQALNEFLAIFTSIRQTTRESAETIATGLRTIFTRIQRTDTIEALRDYGISLTDVEGKFVGAYKAVELLSRGLSTLDPRDIRFSGIVEELGGFRQIGKVIPLIQQFSVAQQALGVAQRGQGSLAKDAAVAQQSLANQISKVREEFLSLMRTIGSSDTFQTIARSALGFTSVLLKVANAIKGVLPVLAIIGAGKIASGIGQYTTGFFGGLTKTKEGNQGGGGAGPQPMRPVFPVGGGGPSAGSPARDLSVLDDLLRQNTQAINALGTNLNSVSTSLGSIGQYSQAVQANTASLINNTTSIDNLTQAMNNSGGNNVVQSINNLNRTVVNATNAIGRIIQSRGAGPATLNKGGKVLGFNRGGVVPGVGNGDTVPAMLEPGEFVIRKKAVETIGAGNLQKMNKYAGGGKVIVDYADNDLDFDTVNQKLASSVNDIANQINPKKNTRINKNKATNLPNYAAITGSLFEAGLKSASQESFAQPNDDRQNFDFPTGINNVKAYNKLNNITSDAKRSFTLTGKREWNQGNIFKKISNTLGDRLDSTNQDFGVAVMKKGLDTEFSWTPELVQKYTQNKNLGGIIQKFAEGSPGGVKKRGIDWKNLSKGRGKQGARGARDKFDIPTTTEYLKWARDIYDEYDADPSLVWATDEIGIRMPPEIAMANRLIGQYVFERGGAGIALGKRFVRTPSDKVTDELRPYLVQDPSDPTQFGFYEDDLRPFMRTKKASKAVTAKMGKEAALSAREAEISKYTTAESAISQFKKPIEEGGGVLNVDSGIMDYIVRSISNPSSLPLEPKELAKLRKKLTKPNLDAFNALIGPDKTPVSVQGQRTKLSEIFGTILETYGSDVSDLEVDSIISGIGTKSMKADTKSLGGMIQRFMAGSVVKEVKEEQTTKVIDPMLQKLLDRIQRVGGTTRLYGYVGKPEMDRIIRQNVSSIDKPSATQIVSAKWLGAKGTDRFGDRTQYSEALKQIVEIAETKYNQDQAVAAQKAVLQTQAGSANKFGLASIFPLGASDTSEVREVEGKNGQKYLTQIVMKGLPPKYSNIIEKYREKFRSAPSDMAQEIQYANIFGTSGPLAFDFDETLVKDADIYTPDGNIDIPGYSDINKVQEALKNAKLTLLGQELQKRLDEYPNLLDNIRILTARPQNNAPLLAAKLQELGLNIPESKITGVNGGLNKVKNLSYFETLIDDNLANLESVRDRSRGGLGYPKPGTAIGYREPTGYREDLASSVRSQKVIEGYIAEELLRELGAPLKSEESDPVRPIDYPNGLGVSADIWGFPANMPTDVKREINSSAISRLWKEAKRFYVTKFNTGGKVDPLLEKYKTIIASIMPAEMLDANGLFSIPGSSDLEITQKRSFTEKALALLGLIPRGAFYEKGFGYTDIKYRLAQYKDSIPQDDYAKLNQIIESQSKQATRKIYVPKGQEIDLAHEAVHDIQEFLKTTSPEVYSKLTAASVGSKEAVSKLYSQYKNLFSYSMSEMFPQTRLDSPYLRADAPFVLSKQKLTADQQSVVQEVASQTDIDMANDEIIATLVGLHYRNIPEAGPILDNIFKQSGLNADFSSREMARFFWGGKVDPLAKKYGLTQKEFNKQEKIAQMMGLSKADFEEKLKLFASRKQRGKDIKFGLLDTQAEFMASSAMVSEEEAALEEFLKSSTQMNIGGKASKLVNLFANGGGVSSRDTVPALLTPGEFVINKEAAQRIGYGKLEKLNQADKLKGYNKGGFVGGVQKFAAGGTAGYDDSAVASLMTGLEMLAKAARDAAFQTERAAGASVADAWARAQAAGGAAISREANARFATAPTARDQANLTEALNRLMSGSAPPGTPTPSPIDRAAIQAAEALEYFTLQAEYYGTSVSKFTKDLRQQIISQTLDLGQQTPQNINRFRTRVGQLKTTLTAPATPDNADRIADAREELADSLKEITGIYDDSRIDASLRELESNLNDTSLSFGEAINNSRLLSGLFADATNKGRQYERVLEQFSQATGVAVEELKKVASLEDVTRAEDNRKLIQSTNKLTSNLNKIAAGLATFGGVLSSLIDAPNNRSARVASAAIGGGTQTAGSLLAFGSNILSTTASTAAIEGGGALATGAQALLPILTNPITLAVGGVVVGLGGLAAAAKDASNAAREFDLEKTSEQIEQSMDRVSQYFKSFAADLKNLNLLDSIRRELIDASGAAFRNLDIQAEVPQTFWFNILDALGSGDEASAQRSMILQQEGVLSYLGNSQFMKNPLGFILQGATLGFGDSILRGISGGNLGLGVGTDSSSAMEEARGRSAFMQQYAPELARQRSQTLQPIAENILRLFEERLRSGTSIEDVNTELGTINAPTKFAEAIARANPLIEEQIIRLKASNQLNDAEKQARINQIVLMEAQYTTGIRTDAVLKELEFKRLSQETKVFTTSIKRMLNAMDSAIGKTAYEIEKLSSAAELSNQALSGSAQAGEIFIRGINILQNRRAYSQDDQRFGVSQASNIFPAMSDSMTQLLNISDKMEDVVLSTINKTIRNTPEEASPERIAGAVRAALNVALDDIGLPPELSEKLSKATQNAFAELRKGENKNLSFAELVEKVPQFADSIQAAKEAQDSAIKALEFWQTRVNEYAKAMNQSMEYQVEANNRFRKSFDVRIKAEEDLARTLGKPISLLDQQQTILNQTGSLTGGVTNPNEIRDAIFRLENTRVTQQSLVSQASQGGPENQEAVQKMTRNLNRTNLALRENYEALKNMADSSDLASAALAKMNELQQRNQAGQNLIEKAVTSNASEIMKFNRSLYMLNRNMSGELNTGSTAQQRSDVLQTFSLIAPLLGDRQNELKANVFESLLLESGVGIGGLFADVLTSLRNPEADPVMSEAISIYKQGVALQSKANEALGKISEAMSMNTAESAGRALASVLNAPIDQQIILLQDINEGINTLVKLAQGNQPQQRADGGMIYANNGMFVNFKAKGTDTVPAMLTPGEFVVNRAATQKNLPLLQNINSGKTSYYARGGMVVDPRWAASGYQGREKEQRTTAQTAQDLVTQKSYPEFKDITKVDSLSSNSAIYAAPASYYATGASEGSMGDSFWDTAPNPTNDPNTKNRGLYRESIRAKAGISFDSLKLSTNGFGRSRLATFNPSALPADPDILNKIGSIPNVPEVDTAIDITNIPKKPIRESSIEAYKNAYKKIIGLLNNLNPLREKVDKAQVDTTSQENEAIRYFQDPNNGVKLTASKVRGSSQERWQTTLSNLTKTFPGDSSFLYTSNRLDRPGDLGNILALDWGGGYTRAVAGLSSIKQLKSNIGGGQLSVGFSSPENQYIKRNIDKLEKLYTEINSAYEDVKRADLDFVESDVSATRKSYINKLDDLYDKKVFSVSLGSEIFKEQNDIDLPLTLYNIDEASWKNYVQTKDQRLADKKFARDARSFIKLQPFDDSTPPTYGDVRTFPWASAGFDMMGIYERFGKEFDGSKPIQITPKTYGKVGTGKFYINYNEILGKLFNEKTGNFDGPDQKYIVVNPNDQDSTLNPGSPLLELPADRSLFFEGDINNLVKFLEERTPSYNTLTGETIDASVKPAYTYKFLEPTTGLIANRTPNIKKLLDQNTQYASNLDIQKFIVAATDSSRTGTKYLDTYTLISEKYKKSKEDRINQFIKDKRKSNASKTSDADIFSLKETLTEADKKAGLTFQDLESFSDEKRVTFARSFYDSYARSFNIKAGKPKNLNDIVPIANELDSRLSEISLKEGGTGGRNWTETNALRAIFTSLYRPASDDAGYFKRLGFPLDNKSFLNRIPPPLDPAEPERTPIQYYDKLAKDIDNEMRLLFQRETDFWRAKENNNKPNRTSLPDLLKQKIQADTDGFSLTEINRQTGEITQFKDKQKIQSWADVEKVALNPYNIPSKSSNRQNILNQLSYYYKNDKDANGNNIWPKERWEFIGDKPLYPDVDNLIADNITKAKPKTLREWYSIQDNILNNSKDPSDIDAQVQELDKVNDNLFNNLIDSISFKHKYLTGLVYGPLPGLQYLKDRLGVKKTELEENKPDDVVAGDPNFLNRGGVVYASTGKYIDFKPRGTDTVPAMLTPGEFVVNKTATQNNLPLLQAMNNGGVIYRVKGSKRPEQGGGTLTINPASIGPITVSGGSSGANLGVTSSQGTGITSDINDVYKAIKTIIVDTSMTTLSPTTLPQKEKVPYNDSNLLRKLVHAIIDVQTTLSTPSGIITPESKLSLADRLSLAHLRVDGVMDRQSSIFGSSIDAEPYIIDPEKSRKSLERVGVFVEDPAQSTTTAPRNRTRAGRRSYPTVPQAAPGTQTGGFNRAGQRVQNRAYAEDINQSDTDLPRRGRMAPPVKPLPQGAPGTQTGGFNRAGRRVQNTAYAEDINQSASPITAEDTSRPIPYNGGYIDPATGKFDYAEKPQNPKDINPETGRPYLERPETQPQRQAQAEQQSRQATKPTAPKPEVKPPAATPVPQRQAQAEQQSRQATKPTAPKPEVKPPAATPVPQRQAQAEQQSRQATKPTAPKPEVKPPAATPVPQRQAQAEQQSRQATKPISPSTVQQGQTIPVDSPSYVGSLTLSGGTQEGRYGTAEVKPSVYSGQSRVWYGGKLWDQNRDGIETSDEKLIGSLSSVDTNGDVIIIRDEDRRYGKTLRLDPYNFDRFATPEDRAIVQSWLDLNNNNTTATPIKNPETILRKGNNNAQMIAAVKQGETIAVDSKSYIGPLTLSGGTQEGRYGAVEVKPSNLVNKNRLWYGGRLWDLNNDGKEQEKITGIVKKILDSQRVMIQTDAVPGGELILRTEFMTPDDINVVKAFHANQKTKERSSTQSDKRPIQNPETVLIKQSDTARMLASVKKGESISVNTPSYSGSLTLSGGTQQGRYGTAEVKPQVNFNQSRLWYGGRLWDLNNDGKEQEKIIGTVTRILDAKRVMINTQNVPGGQLILRREFMTQDDLNIVKSFQDNQAAKPINRQFGGVVYANNGQLIDFQPRGTDTVPAMLTPGEFVVNANATKKNLGLLQSINGGDNGYSSGGVIYREDGGSVDKVKPWWRKPQGASDLYYEIMGGKWSIISQGKGAQELENLKQILEFNKHNQGKPKKWDGSYWSQEDYQRWADFINQSNLSEYEKQERLAEFRRKESFGPSIYEQMEQDRLFAAENSRDWQWTTDRSWRAFFGFPTTGNISDQLQSMLGGALQALLPTIFGTLGAVGGTIVGTALAGPVGGVGGGLVGAAGGSNFGNAINKWIYNAFKGTSIVKDFESVMKENPQSAFAGQTAVNIAGIASGTSVIPTKFTNLQSALQTAGSQAVRSRILALPTRPTGQVGAAITAMERNLLRSIADSAAPAANSLIKAGKEFLVNSGQNKASEYFTKYAEGTLGNTDTAEQYNSGGIVYANNGQLIDFQPRGTDTVPAMLTPGEFVVNRAATQKHLPLLKAINSGSNSKAYSKGGVVYLEKGGELTDDDVQQFRNKNILDIFDYKSISMSAAKLLSEIPYDYAFIRVSEMSNDVAKLLSQLKGDILSVTLPSMTDEIAMTLRGGFKGNSYLRLGTFLNGISDDLASQLVNNIPESNKQRSRLILDFENNLSDSAANILKGYSNLELYGNVPPSAIDILADNSGSPLRSLTLTQENVSDLGSLFSSNLDSIQLPNTSLTDEDIEKLIVKPDGTPRQSIELGNKFLSAKIAKELIKQRISFDFPNLEDMEVGAATEISKMSEYMRITIKRLSKDVAAELAKKSGALSLSRIESLSDDAMLELVKFKGEDLSIYGTSNLTEVGLQALDNFANNNPNLRLYGDIRSALEKHRNVMTEKDKVQLEFLIRRGSRRTEGQQKRYEELKQKQRDNLPPEQKARLEDREWERLKRKGNLNPEEQARLEELQKNRESRRTPEEKARIQQKTMNREYEGLLRVPGRDRTPEQQARLDELRDAVLTPEQKAKRQRKIDEREHSQLFRMGRSERTPEQQARLEELEQVIYTPDQRAKRQANQDNIEYQRLARIPDRDRTPEQKARLEELISARLTPEQRAKRQRNLDKRKWEDEVRGLHKGGVVYASNGQLINFQPQGTDTVPAMLTPGEFVINKKSTQKHLQLLQAINNGSDTHQNMISRFNIGGYVKPNYYQAGSYVAPSSPSSQNNSFDFAGFMQKLMGQLSSAITGAIQNGLKTQSTPQNIDNNSNGVSINIESQVLDRINEFTNRLRSVADTLAGLSAIPSEIKITGRHDVNVIINGDSVLNQLNPEIQQIVMNEIRNSFRNLVNQNSPVPSDKLINPFDSNIS